MTFPRAARGSAGLLAALLLLLSAACLYAQYTNLPAKPTRYITDEAGILDADTLDTLNSQLEQFEKDTSNQFLVVIYPSLPPDAELYQYCTQVAQTWAPGQQDKNNGVVWFIFVSDHKMYFAVGRGLEGSLTDALTTNIRLQVINPHFKQGDYAGGIEAGITAIIAASKGEYQGDGTTDDQRNGGGQPPDWLIIAIFIAIFIFVTWARLKGYGGPIVYTSGGWGGGGYGGGGGWGGGGGGGGFSSGGGSFGGGGSGGSW
jgi:uncharacterized protein